MAPTQCTGRMSVVPHVPQRTRALHNFSVFQPRSHSHGHVRIVRARATIATRKNSVGEDLIVKLAHFMLDNPVLNQMGVAAAQMVMKKTAEQKGIPWGQHKERLTSKRELLNSIKAELENKDISYPDYYLVPMHAYAEGNLNWRAAFEAEPLRLVVAARTFKEMGAAEAAKAFDDNILNAIKDYRHKNGLSSTVSSIVDLGCGTGESTTLMANAFPQSSVQGLDLSPHFLSVAQLRHNERLVSGQSASSVRFIHGLAEASGLTSSSCDLVLIQFVLHECPAAAIKSILREACRLLQPGGQLAIVDTDPDSKTVKNLHPAILLLREQTEPWMDEFRNLPLAACLEDLGLLNVEVQPVSNRHMSVMGSKP